MAGNIKIVVDIGLARDPVTVMTPIIDAAKKTRKAVAAEEKGMTEDEKKELAKRLAAERRFAQDQRIILANSLTASKKHFRDRRAAEDAAVKDGAASEVRAFAASKQRRATNEREAIADTRAELRGVYNERARAAAKTKLLDDKAARDHKQAEVAAAKESRRVWTRNLKDDQEQHEGRNAAAAERRRFVRNTIYGAGGVGLAAAGMAYKGLQWAGQGFGVNTDLTSHMRSAAEMEQRATTLSNTAYQPGGEGDKGMRQDAGVLTREVRQTADMAALDPGDVMSGLQAFVAKTGDLRMGRDIMAEMARLTKATDANFADMIDAAGDAANELRGTENAADSLKEVMRGIAGQGKLGAVEIKDLAKQMAKVAASAGQFGGDRKQNMLFMGALAQEARGGGGAASASQAATSVMSFTAQFQKKARIAGFKSLGIDPHDKYGNIRDPNELILELLQKTGGDTRKMNVAIADQQAKKVTNPLAQIYREAYQGAGGSAEHRTVVASAAYRREIARLMDATMKETEIAESFARAMATSQSETQLLNNGFARVGEELLQTLLPAFNDLAPHLIGMTQTFADLVQWGLKFFGLTDEKGKDAKLFGAGETGIKAADFFIQTLSGDASLYSPTQNQDGTWNQPYYNTQTGAFQQGVYDVEHVRGAKAKLPELQTSLKAEEKRLAELERSAPRRYVDENGEPLKKFVTVAGTEIVNLHPTKEQSKNAPDLIDGYFKDDVVAGHKLTAQRAAVDELREKSSRLAYWIDNMEKMRDGNALRVINVTKAQKPAPKVDADSTTDLSLTSHE